MATQLLPLLPGTLATGVCFSSEQERLNAFMAVSNAVLSGGLAFYNYGDTKPSVANQGYPWFRTTDGRWYYFSGVWKAPVNYSPYERRLFVGDLTDLQTYDGGDTGAAGPTSGPMWEQDTSFAGRSPMGPGAIPTSNPAKTLTVEEDYGQGAHTMTTAELATHSHPPRSGFDAFAGFVSVGQPSSYEITGGTEIERTGATGDTGDSEPMPIVHPVRGVFIVKWTGRLYWVAS